MLANLASNAGPLLEAVRRIAALAITDVALAAPEAARPACAAALDTLRLRPSNGSDFMYYRPSLRPSALLVLCHPSKGPSMCRRLAEIWEEELQRIGITVQRVDLESGLALGSEEELRAALTGRDDEEVVPQEVKRLQGLVEESQFLIFVHPIFWFDVPSQLKAFEESVLSSGFAFRKLPSHPLLNRAAGIVEHVPVARTLMRRYASYGLLRDKSVFVTRTQGGPAAGMGIFGHEATSLESAMQFCGCSLAAVDRVAELDDTSQEDVKNKVLPKLTQRIQAHCKEMLRLTAPTSPSVAIEDAIVSDEVKSLTCS